MSDSDADPSFLALPLRVRRRIDRAFGAWTRPRPTGDGPVHKRRKLDASASATPGGFIPDDGLSGGGFVNDFGGGGFLPDEGPSGGGFLPEPSRADSGADEDADEDGASADAMPFSAIPSALQALDLQPDDEDVLAVFRNAATGWENKGGAQDDDDAHLLVGRKDWRAVCAALLDVGVRDGDEDGDVEMDDEDAADLSEPSEEEYVASDDEEDDAAEGDSDDEYQDGGFVRENSTRKAGGASRGRKGRSATTSSLSPDASDDDDLADPSRRVTARQKAEARHAFAMFFPDVPDAELDRQRLMIKDITRMASLINLKLTAEEIVQMLGAFSTQPDQSMSLPDFERMMVTAKLA
ncbi:hypothetical protein PsYK624_073010 [Phanerochaete sordida]|uniref:Uncharacterized protein n=1 Tax=Phanerochaete sordida TaxID=48140 RepID=A0A9P3LEM7_9APHY|nr:hypothetical protein PsYK624_073010 [Phanerochaete sordida]